MVDITRIRFKKKGAVFLSPLETDVLNALWKLEKARVRDLYEHLRPRRKVALTSVAVGLDRLHTKKIVARTVAHGRGGPHYIYTPLKSQAELQASIIEGTVDRLIHSFGDVAVNYFNERFSKRGRR